MNKHTPGPWTIDNSNGATYINQGNQPIVPITICRLTSNHTTANANLIAAAPELLEALEGIRELMGIDWLLPEFDEAREAIAKAKGEL